ncbi:MAG TPA: hypothetical protein VKB65_10600 [Myxococcota bacterium]|nr:hypothetical protein [Myxococcota bacterium]
MSSRPFVLLLSLAGLLGLAGASIGDCRGKEHTNVAPSAEQMDEQHRDEARQELEHDVGEAARDERLGEELGP